MGRNKQGLPEIVEPEDILPKRKPGRPTTAEKLSRAMVEKAMEDAVLRLGHEMTKAAREAVYCLRRAMRGQDGRAAVAAARTVVEFLRPRTAGIIFNQQINSGGVEVQQLKSHLGLPVAPVPQIEAVRPELPIRGQERPRPTLEVMPEIVLPEKSGGREYSDGFKPFGEKPAVPAYASRFLVGRDGVKESKQGVELKAPEVYPEISLAPK